MVKHGLIKAPSEGEEEEKEEKSAEGAAEEDEEMRAATLRSDVRMSRRR